jgi:hypothetical protein
MFISTDLIEAVLGFMSVEIVAKSSRNLRRIDGV